jgi:HSP20 family protein
MKNDERLFNDFDHIVHNIWNAQRRARRGIPAVDIAEETERYLIEIDLPGFSEEDVTISVENGMLTVASAQSDSDRGAERTYIVRERGARSFSRSFALPRDASHEGIEGVMRHGVLTVTIPKREEAKPRHIEVGSE